MIQVQDLPLAWFDRPQYRPRLRRGDRQVWFVLDPALAPAAQVPAAPPAEPDCGRAALVEAFRSTYRDWRLPSSAAAERSIEALAQTGTAVVVAGQQPGFLGGPLYTLYKALGAIAAARRYRALTGREAVPVFWVAGEDHDLEEVRAAYLPGRGGGQEAAFRLPHLGGRRPLADYVVDAETLEVLARAGEHLAARRHAGTARGLLELYPGRNLAAAFAAILIELLGHTGLLVLDPVTVRPLVREIFRRVIEEAEDVVAAIAAGRKQVEERGIEPVVAERLPLFVIDGGERHHLSPAEGGLRLDGGGPVLARKKLLEMLDGDPRTFSGGALLRPIIQQAVLPCVLTIGGPAEVGYFAQIAPLSRQFGQEAPRIGLRPSATLIEGKLARTAAALTLEAIASARSPEDLLPLGGDPRSIVRVKDLARQAEGLLLAAVDELAPPGEAARLRARAREIPQDMLRLCERLSLARVRQQTVELEGAKKLWGFLFPAGSLQERRWNALHFIAKHGTGWLDEFIEAIKDDPLRIAHRWVTFAEG